MFLCPYVLRVSGSLRRQPLCFFGHADVSPWPAAQRPFVYLMNTYVAYVFRAKRLTQTLYLLFLCPFVLMFSALAANLIEHHNILTPSLSTPLNGVYRMFSPPSSCLRLTHTIQPCCCVGAALAAVHQPMPQSHDSELLLCPPGCAVALRACGQAHCSACRTVRP